MLCVCVPACIHRSSRSRSIHAELLNVWFSFRLAIPNRCLMLIDRPANCSITLHHSNGTNIVVWLTFTFWFSVGHTSFIQLITCFQSKNSTANSESLASLHFATRLNFNSYDFFRYLIQNLYLCLLVFTSNRKLFACYFLFLFFCLSFDLLTYLCTLGHMYSYILLLLLFWMVLLLFFAGVSASVAAFEAFAALALMLLRYQKNKSILDGIYVGFRYVAALRYFSVYVQAFHIVFLYPSEKMEHVSQPPS